MSELFKQNERVLREVRRALFEQGAAAEPSAQLVVRSELAKAGVPTLFLDGEGPAGYLYSRYQPLVEAERWAVAQKAEQSDEIEGVLVFGFGLGYHIRALRKVMGAAMPIFVYEPSWEIFRTAMQAVDLTDLLQDEELYLYVGADIRQAAKQAAAFIGRNLFNTAWLEWPAYRRSFPETITRYAEHMSVQAQDVRIEQNTMLFFEKAWPRNLLYNLDKILKNPGLNALKDKIAGRPAIVVAAGPSLSKNVDLLHELKGKAAILCVDTAYRVLQQKGIRPDLIFALDGSEKNYRHFTDVKPEGVPLVFLPGVHHKIVELYGEKSFTSNVFDPLLQEVVKDIEPRGSISYSGSVATLAFETACVMGADPVVFIGQDLAYPGGQAYASGTMFETMTKSIEDGRVMMYVEGVDGQQVLTDAALDKYRRYFEERIEDMDGERLFIDATEGGAKIAGTTLSTLRDVLERYCQEPFDYEGVIDQVAVPTGEDLAPARAALKKMHRTLHQIARLTRIAQIKNRDLRDLYKVKRLRTGKVAETNAALDRIEAQIKRLNEHKWLDATMQSLLLAITKGQLSKEPANETEYAKAMRITENSHLLYAGMLEAAEEIKAYLEVALERIGEETKLGETAR